MAIHRHAAWLLLGWALAGHVGAFEIGDREKGRAQSGTHYGNPVHEDMTRASRTLARSASPELQCKPSMEQLDLLLNTQVRGRVSSAMCCHPGAKAKLCPQLVHGNAPELMDEDSLITGSRWNDDPCHLMRSSATVLSWMLWMEDPFLRNKNNANYASHYREKQFLHAMAPQALGDADALPARQTFSSIMTWAQFAYKVADGTLSPDLTLGQAVEALPYTAEGKARFASGFESYYGRKIGFLFTGVSDPDPLQVRQIALGALLHTLQDSYSSSHVLREREATYPRRPFVLSKGRVLRFYTYQGQTPTPHHREDRPPRDRGVAKTGAEDHPVAYGAQLIACAAASTSAQPTWEQAEKTLNRSFGLAASIKKNPASTAGPFIADLPLY